ncbi:MAG: pirin-like C-terminal cupin domain-containing protein, partial [Clostridium sp.]|nr:pirin-like C-terminal cupin domain-containing protein [Clostridium sp.]
IAGDYKGYKGAFEGKYIKTTYLDVELPANREWHFINDAENTLFVYIFSGKAIFDPDKSVDNLEDLVDEKQAVLFSHDNEFWIKAADESVRFILLSAKPLKEPIAWGGPIVMNTNKELQTAFEELDNNNFIKSKDIKEL